MGQFFSHVQYNVQLFLFLFVQSERFHVLVLVSTRKAAENFKEDEEAFILVNLRKKLRIQRGSSDKQTERDKDIQIKTYK